MSMNEYDLLVDVAHTLLSFVDTEYTRELQHKLYRDAVELYNGRVESIVTMDGPRSVVAFSKALNRFGDRKFGTGGRDDCKDLIRKTIKDTYPRLSP
jgi:hypothetical protein